jgi:hypothetical protein
MEDAVVFFVEDSANPRYDLEGRLIDFTVRIYTVAESIPGDQIGNYFEPKKLDPITTECNELISIFVKSITTAKSNMK